MTKISIILAIATGVLITYEDVPLHILFSLPLVATLLELNLIKKNTFSIIIYFLSSVIYGFGLSAGVKEFFPNLYIGGLRILSILVVTTFGYATILYLLSNKTIQKLIESKILKKFKNDNDSNI